MAVAAFPKPLNPPRTPRVEIRTPKCSSSRQSLGVPRAGPPSHWLRPSSAGQSQSQAWESPAAGGGGVGGGRSFPGKGFALRSAGRAPGSACALGGQAELKDRGLSSALFCRVVLLEERSQGKNGARLRNQKRSPVREGRDGDSGTTRGLGTPAPWDQNTHSAVLPSELLGMRGPIRLPGLTHTEKLL